jgi:cytoskeleton protein RodZ
MSTVAEQLRAGREAKNLTIAQVAEATKIRTDHVRALEEGNFNVFSAPVYIRGSVKNYAKLLRLDEAPLMAALDGELNRTENFNEPPPLSEATTNTLLDRLMFLLSKLNMKIVMIVGAILAVVLIVWLAGMVLHHSKARDPLSGLPPAVYQPGNSGDTLPLPKR